MKAGLSSSTPTIPLVPGQTKEVVIGGVAFESSGRSLVRKDLPKASKPISSGKVPGVPPPFAGTPRHLAGGRGFRPKGRRGRGGRNMNMTLNNTNRPYQLKKAPKRKLIDKPCARFTTTGACSRGLTCPYQHDPSKIAICWNFLQDNCSNSAETCNLSHDPIPERTPLCVHFLNKGRCTRENCPFPHVNVGQRDGVCRDFAVLGYCERGLECKHQHVRECPDFAEKGTCETKGCKLPHVIRANRTRKTGGGATTLSTSTKTPTSSAQMDLTADTDSQGAPMLTAEDGQLGDDFISLTFRESDSDEDQDDDEEEQDGDSGEDDDEDVDEQDDDEPELEVHM
ncbi:hypothetical protein CPB83DRAFT_851019 [Crepidotus variabilis]|uniref:C3H1-type domain-containing protein n=1 Tax=Crepidotus variabilis TaxID=179855 RepID=A0A9P6EK07_9AGAR|nr:hypothetical protein CPB83DRAFT_851019 [Crepidotus variabilis]